MGARGLTSGARCARAPRRPNNTFASTSSPFAIARSVGALRKRAASLNARVKLGRNLDLLCRIGLAKTKPLARLSCGWPDALRELVVHDARTGCERRVRQLRLTQQALIGQACLMVPNPVRSPNAERTSCVACISVPLRRARPRLVSPSKRAIREGKGATASTVVQVQSLAFEFSNRAAARSCLANRVSSDPSSPRSSR